MVGLSGLEPPTSRLSGVRSNQLSYRPTQTASWEEFEPGGDEHSLPRPEATARVTPCPAGRGENRGSLRQRRQAPE